MSVEVKGLGRGQEWVDQTVEKKVMDRTRRSESKVPGHYHLRLFVAGDEPNSRKAKEVLKYLGERHLQGNYTLEVVDVLENYKAALEAQILFAPTLMIIDPPTKTRIIGSLSDVRRILEVLGLPEAEENP
jgi:circadian clock protein KaiB